MQLLINLCNAIRHIVLDFMSQFVFVFFPSIHIFCITISPALHLRCPPDKSAVITGQTQSGNNHTHNKTQHFDQQKKNHLKGAQRFFYFLQLRESSTISNTFRNEALISFSVNHLLSVPRKQKSCSAPFSVLSNHENEENKKQPYGCKQQQP